MKINDYCDIEGKGEPVVFIHGSFSSSAAWRPYTESLAADYQCLSIKLPGHSSPKLSKEETATFENDVEFVEYLLGRLVNRPIKLVGHSYGATLCGELAMRNNIEIECMTLFEPVSVWALRNIGNEGLHVQMQEFLTKLYSSYHIAPELICQLVIDFWNNEEIFDSLPDRVKKQMLPLAEFNIQHWNCGAGLRHENSQINDMLTPTTTVSGTASHPIAREISRFLAKTMTNAKHVELPQANHFLITTHTSECVAIIERGFQYAIAGRCLERQGLLEQDAENAWLELEPADNTDAMPHSWVIPSPTGSPSARNRVARPS